jgi:hypothetical protein
MLGIFNEIVNILMIITALSDVSCVNAQCTIEEALHCLNDIDIIVIVVQVCYFQILLGMHKCSA